MSAARSRPRRETAVVDVRVLDTAAQYVAASRARQGLPERLEDESVLEAIAAAIARPGPRRDPR